MDDTNNKPQDTQNGVQEAEIIETDSEIIEEASGGENLSAGDKAAQTVQTLITVERQIKSHLENLDKLREETRVAREMVESLLQNDPAYMEAAEEAKKASKVKAEARKNVLSQPGAKVSAQKLKDLREQNKELQDGLSFYLQEFQRLTGANEFEGADGELRSIVYHAKLVKKRG